METFFKLLKGVREATPQELVMAVHECFKHLSHLSEEELVAAYHTVKTCEAETAGINPKSLDELKRAIRLQMQQRIFGYELNSEMRQGYYYQFKEVTGEEFKWFLPDPPTQ